MDAKQSNHKEEEKEGWKTTHKTSKDDFNESDAKEHNRNNISASKGWDEAPQEKESETKRRFILLSTLLSFMQVTPIMTITFSFKL